ncbi:hypothetical protein DXG03_005407 [Asterophora parasitica]|uniref:Uncharacterized protein n=1 Tax=Asterophora parasitica TaxID=117018 RepID=A0A9P7GEH8_9AGAR|nr:hypothetical protein DXG03_005407 [Asterophora parasitica]
MDADDGPIAGPSGISRERKRDDLSGLPHQCVKCPQWEANFERVAELVQAPKATLQSIEETLEVRQRMHDEALRNLDDQRKTCALLQYQIREREESVQVMDDMMTYYQDELEAQKRQSACGAAEYKEETEKRIYGLEEIIRDHEEASLVERGLTADARRELIHLRETILREEEEREKEDTALAEQRERQAKEQRERLKQSLKPAPWET